MNLANLLKKIHLAFEETWAFSQYPTIVNGITDDKGGIHVVQAPALKYLEPNIPQDINFQWLLKNEEGRMVATWPTDRRRVVRRDSGIVPIYYFVP